MVQLIVQRQGKKTRPITVQWTTDLHVPTSADKEPPMSATPPDHTPVAVAAEGLTVHVAGDADEVEAHAAKFRGGPAETEAHMPFRKGPAETEAHMPYKRGVPAETEAHGRRVLAEPAETEAHGFRLSPADPAIDAYAKLTLAFPADAPEQVFEVRYRPAATPGGEPEVELHGRRIRP
jgi:hypothetical protein